MNLMKFQEFNEIKEWKIGPEYMLMSYWGNLNPLHVLVNTSTLENIFFAKNSIQLKKYQLNTVF
jgi:hypothetical protein